jgi:hypothetical protein
MFPKKGNKLHRKLRKQEAKSEFERAVASALKSELGSSHRAVKTVMAWTDASERTAKHWLAGTHGPSGRHLIALARHSNAVMTYFVTATGRHPLLVGMQLAELRSKLLNTIELIDASSASDSQTDGLADASARYPPGEQNR